MTITLYGIKNCDTMKKARSWLDAHEVQYAFHDYKAAGIDPAVLAHWCSEVGWETLLNRAGTTFRKLPENQKQNMNERKAMTLMAAQPSMIKRPVLEYGKRLLVGFTPEVYEQVVRGQIVDTKVANGTGIRAVDTVAHLRWNCGSCPSRGSAASSSLFGLPHPAARSAWGHSEGNGRDPQGFDARPNRKRAYGHGRLRTCHRAIQPGH